MSHYIHYIIETRKTSTDKWETFEVLTNPSSNAQYVSDGTVKVGETEYYKTIEYVCNFLTLRDYFFGHCPWCKDSLFNRYVPETCSERTNAALKEWYDGKFSIYSCTCEDLDKVMATYEEKYKNALYKEITLNYTAELMSRMNHSDDAIIDTPPEIEDELTDMKYIINQLSALSESVENLVSTVTNDYYCSNNIRLLIWTD